MRRFPGNKFSGKIEKKVLKTRKYIDIFWIEQCCAGYSSDAEVRKIQEI